MMNRTASLIQMELSKSKLMLRTLKLRLRCIGLLSNMRKTERQNHVPLTTQACMHGYVMHHETCMFSVVWAATRRPREPVRSHGWAAAGDGGDGSTSSAGQWERGDVGRVVRPRYGERRRMAAQKTHAYVRALVAYYVVLHVRMQGVRGKRGDGETDVMLPPKLSVFT